MATYSKFLLSGSTNGKNILISATGTTGNTIHTAVAGTSDFDEIWIYASNTDTADRKITLEWGETATPNGTVEVTIPSEDGWILIVPGLLLQNSLVVTAYSVATNVILINGFVNRITA